MGAEEDQSLIEWLPEHGKLIQISDKSQIIGEFLDELFAQGWVFARFNDDDELEFDSRGITEVLAAYYDIDLDVIEREKRAMLQALSQGTGGEEE